MDEYEDIWIYQINRQDEIIYSQGLMDGMMFGYWVALDEPGSGEDRGVSCCLIWTSSGSKLKVKREK